MLERLLRQRTEQATHILTHSIVAMVAHKLHDGRPDLGAWPEATGRHLSDNRDIVVELDANIVKLKELRYPMTPWFS